MNHSYYSITLDVKAIQSQVTLPVKQGDTTRGVYISFVDGGEAYIIEEDCFAVFKGEKSDGSELGNYCTIEDNKIIYPFTPETVSSPGVIACEVSLYNTKEELITSARFSIFVDSRLVGSENYKSSSEYTSLEEFLIKVELAEEERVRAEEARKNTFVIDTELDEDSENPVSNKVITEMFNLITEAFGELDDRYERVLYKSHDIFDDTSGYPSYPTTKAVYDYGQKILETIQGDLDEIGDIVGGEDDGVYRINGFAYYEEYEAYLAPFTDPLPNIEGGIYQISVNGKAVEGCVTSGEGGFYVASNGTPKTFLLFYGGESIFGSGGMVQSYYPIEETVELKITKPKEFVDYGIFIEPDPDDGSSGIYTFYCDKNALNTNDEKAEYDFEIYDADGNLVYNPSWNNLHSGYDDAKGMFVASENGIDTEVYEAIQNSINTNKPMTFVFTQTLENGEVNKKTVSGVPTIRDDLFYVKGQNYYCWGNTDAFVLGI